MEPLIPRDNQLAAARILAAAFHADQRDKLGLPYINHLSRVAGRVAARLEETPELLGPDAGHVARVSAWLHDLVEDTPVTLDDVRALFGPSVAITLEGLTRREEETYAQFIARAAAGSPATLVVKVADVEDHLDPEFAAGLTPSMRAKYDRALAALTVALDQLQANQD